MPGNKHSAFSTQHSEPKTFTAEVAEFAEKFKIKFDVLGVLCG